MKRALPVVLCLLAISACGKKGTPTEPTQNQTPTRIIAITGSLAFGAVQVGTSKTLQISIQNSGNTTLAFSKLSGPCGDSFAVSATSGTVPAGGSTAVSVNFKPTAIKSCDGTLTVTSDSTSGTNTLPVTASGIFQNSRQNFGFGTVLVNADIDWGRYYASPKSGCFWARLSGLGGTLSETIANDFWADDSEQIIVDILQTDKAFSSDEDCGPWFNGPRTGAKASISSGIWLIGAQIASGTYRTTASPGCYWERLRNFQGVLSSIIANDFVSGGGQQLVEIRADDAGFNSDGDCGMWTRISSSTSSDEWLPHSDQPADSIRSNWELHRRR